MATVHVELVSVERRLWSGDATIVLARTTEGELGVMAGHAPLLGELAPGGVVRVRQEGGEDLVVAAHGGFLSVTDDGISILAEIAEFAGDIDVERARSALERARGGSDDDQRSRDAETRALTRLRATGETI